MDNQKMRLGLYRKIEIARKQLPAMDEEAFRALLRSEFGVSSRKDMSVNQLSRLVQHFAAVHGVTYTAPAKSRNPRVTPHGRPDFIEITDSMPYAREKRQILAIWRRLLHDQLGHALQAGVRGSCFCVDAERGADCHAAFRFAAPGKGFREKAEGRRRGW